MSIVWGGVAALGWGVAFFLTRTPTRQFGSRRVLYADTWIGLAWLTPFLLLSGELAAHTGGDYWQGWLWAVIATSCNAAANVLFFRAIEIGDLSVVTPISSSYAAFVVLFAFLSGDFLTLPQFTGIGCALIGIVLAVPRTPGQRLSLRDRSVWWGAFLALLASIGYGVGYWMLGVWVAPTVGSVIPVWVGRWTTIAALLFTVRIMRPATSPPTSDRVRWNVWLILAASTLLGNIAFIASNTGYRTGDVAIVTVLASLYSPITVLLAWLFLGERLSRRQQIGLLIIFAGVVLVSV
jgi:drug/metabolite transporter (DMT)-like permease